MSEFEVNKKSNDSGKSPRKQQNQFEFKYIEKKKFEKIVEKVRSDKKNERNEESKSARRSDRTPSNSPRRKEVKTKNESPTKQGKSPRKDIGKNLEVLIEEARKKIKQREHQMLQNAKKDYFDQVTNDANSTLEKDKKESEVPLATVKCRTIEFPRSNKEVLDTKMQQSLKEMQEIERVHLSMLRQSKADDDFEEFEERAMRLVAKIEKGESLNDDDNDNQKTEEKTTDSSQKTISQEETESLSVKDVNSKPGPQWVQITPAPAAFPSNVNPSAAAENQMPNNLFGSYDPALVERYQEFQQYQQQLFRASQQCPQNDAPQMSFPQYPLPFDQNLNTSFMTFGMPFCAGFEHQCNATVGAVYTNQQCEIPQQQQQQPQQIHEDSDLEYEMENRPNYTKHCFPKPNLDEAADAPGECGHAEFVNVESQNNCAMNLCYLVNKTPMRFTDLSDDPSEGCLKENPKMKVVMKPDREEADSGSNPPEVTKEKKTPRKKVKKAAASDKTEETITSPKGTPKVEKEAKQRKEPKLKKQKEQKQDEIDELDEIAGAKEVKENRRIKLKAKRLAAACIEKSVDSPKLSVVDAPKTTKTGAAKKESSQRKKFVPIIECNMNDHTHRTEQSNRSNRTPRSQRSSRSEKMDRSPRPGTSSKSKKQEIVQISQFVTDAMKLEKMRVFKKISNIQESLIEMLDKLKMSLVELHTLNISNRNSNYKSTLDFAVQFTRNYLLPLRTMIIDAQSLSAKAYTQSKVNSPCNRIINIYKLIILAMQSYQKHLRYFCIDQIPNKLISLLEYLHDITYLTIQKGLFDKDDIIIDCLMQRCTKFADFINEIIEERMLSARSDAKSPTKSMQSHFFSKKSKDTALDMYDPKVLKQPSTHPKKSKWLMSGKELNRDSKTDLNDGKPEIDPEEDAVRCDDTVETQVGNIKQDSSGNESLGILNNLLMSMSCDILNEKTITEATTEAVNTALIEALQSATKTQVVKMLEPYLQMLDTAVLKKPVS